MADYDDDMRAELPQLEAAMTQVFAAPTTPLTAGRLTLAAIGLLRPLHRLSVQQGAEVVDPAISEWLDPTIAARVELVINELEVLFDEIENYADDVGIVEGFDASALVEQPRRGL